jgi:hypothetical protein
MPQTLAKPLSGVEVRKAILFDIERALSLDGTFQSHMAFDGFSFQASIVVMIPSGVYDQIAREVSGSRGEVPPDSPATVVSASREIEPPNQTRISTDQPVPTLVDNGKGQIEEKYVPYTEDAGKHVPSVPKQRKNTVK